MLGRNEMSAEDMLMQALMGVGKSGGDKKIRDIEYVREVINRKRLEGLNKGDLIRQLPDSNGNYETANNGDAVVFVRYLTPDEQLALMSRGANPTVEEEDALMCYFVRGDAQLYPINTANYEKVE